MGEMSASKWAHMSPLPAMLTASPALTTMWSKTLQPAERQPTHRNSPGLNEYPCFFHPEAMPMS